MYSRYNATDNAALDALHPVITDPESGRQFSRQEYVEVLLDRADRARTLRYRLKRQCRGLLTGIWATDALHYGQVMRVLGHDGRRRYPKHGN